MTNYYTDDSTVFLDGKWIPAKEAQVSLYNQTMHYGNGVFEGIRSYSTEDGVRVFKAEEHYDRLIRSARKMHISFDYSVEELSELTYALLNRNQLKDAYIRPLVFLEPQMSLLPVEKSYLFLCAWEWGRYLGDRLLRVMTSSYRRPHPLSCHVEAKTTGHYINSILATTEAKQKGYDEALLTDTDGYVAEGPGANFFCEKDGVLFTCPTGNILPGITRQTVMEIAEETGIRIEEKLFTIEEVKRADSAFFTGTAAEIAGISSIDDYLFPLNWEQSLGKKLADHYGQLTTQSHVFK